ncbi:hypothetical protein cce_5283 (plasmid) [Crocosphaera subtropica ATCC 51142]|uniref:Ice-binding protein C-terminal domain-containing protein n=1 Tax=Crocosphaera subtropica (strain ATCC 51142 / BH68) TaxID=43989 RepID=B1X3B8_CROS5|nr:PEP-CTERM sorting domain-containing protein [Crocosphaera subtropica]ACB54629.1 hypothetical protein cce_5283 [Crocosphaera subtropica ATCC 51142]
MFPKTGELVEQLKFVIPVGTQFLVNDLTANNVDISLCTSTCEEVPFWMTNDGKIDPAISGFGFKDDPAGGTYDASSITTQKAPEPGTILGLLAISGLGLGLKRKKQS